MKEQLLETRKGKSRDKTGLPPSVVSVSWSRQSEDLESGSKAGVFSLELGRPVKLSLSQSLLHEVLRTLSQVKEVLTVHLDVGLKNGNRDQVNRNEISMEDKSSSELFVTPQTSMNISSEHGDSESDLKPTEITVTTSQVVVEFIISSSSDKIDTENASQTSSTAPQEIDVSLQGEGALFNSRCVTKEGLVLAWQSLTLSMPPGDKLRKTSELSVDGLQLLSVVQGVSADIVPPLHINSLLTQHRPCSAYDL